MPKDSSLNVTQCTIPYFDHVIKCLKGDTLIQMTAEDIKNIIINLRINFNNINGCNLLAEAIYANNLEVITLLESYATDEEITEARALAARYVDRDAEYTTLESTKSQLLPKEVKPLSIHQIVAEENFEKLNTFLSKSAADIDSKDEKSNFPPIVIAACNGWLEGMKLLIKHDANLGNLLSNSNDEDPRLHGAVAIFNHPKIIDYIVDELKLCTRKQCVIQASQEPELVENLGPLLITLTGGINVYLSEIGTALHHAVRAENIPAIEKLIQKVKVNTEVSNNNGDTPLQFAARAGKAKAIIPLVDNGADPLVQTTSSGENLLHIVDDAATTSMIMSLPIAADLMETVDDAGNLPTHHAVLEGKEEVLNAMLISCPTTIDKTELLSRKGGDNKSIFEMRAEGDEAIRKILMQHGAKEVEEVEEKLANDTSSLEQQLEEPSTPPQGRRDQATPPFTPPKQIKNATPSGTPRKTPIVPKDAHIIILKDLLKAINQENIPEIDAIFRKNDKLDFLSIKIHLENNKDINLESTATIGGINFLQFAFAQEKWLALEKLKEFWLHPAIERLMDAIKRDNYQDVVDIMKDRSLVGIKVMVQEPNEKLGAAIEILKNGTRKVCIKFSEHANNMNLLHLAAMLNKPNSFKALLHSGFDALDMVDTQDTAQNYTAMHYAVEYADENLILLCSPSNGKIHCKRGDETPAELAAYLGKKSILEHILKLTREKLTYIHFLKAIKGSMQDKDLLNMIDKNPIFLSTYSEKTGVNGLMEIAQNKHTYLFKSLFDRAFDGVNKSVLGTIKQVLGASDNYNQNILHYIAKYGTAEMAISFRESARKCFNELVTRKGVEGLPVHAAASRDKQTFEKLYPILAFKEERERVVTKGLFGLPKTTIQIKQELVLDQDDKTLSSTAFYIKYHEINNTADSARLHEGEIVSNAEDKTAVELSGELQELMPLLQHE